MIRCSRQAPEVGCVLTSAWSWWKWGVSPPHTASSTLKGGLRWAAKGRRQVALRPTADLSGQIRQGLCRTICAMTGSRQLRGLKSSLRGSCSLCSTLLSEQSFVSEHWDCLLLLTRHSSALPNTCCPSGVMLSSGKTCFHAHFCCTLLPDVGRTMAPPLSLREWWAFLTAVASLCFKMWQRC